MSSKQSQNAEASRRLKQRQKESCSLIPYILAHNNTQPLSEVPADFKPEKSSFILEFEGMHDFEAFRIMGVHNGRSLVLLNEEEETKPFSENHPYYVLKLQVTERRILS